MGLLLVRVWTGAALVASGTLMYAASWQRWAGACLWGQDQDTFACNRRQDHLYDFLLPTEPWQPVGSAAELAGVSLIVLALALPFLATAVGGHRPGAAAATALLLSTLAVADVGVATLRSGLAGEVVGPVSADLALWLWLFVPLGLFVVLAVRGRGWARAGAILLVLGSPLVAAFSYALGSFDTAPWWEAVSGVLTGAGGLCVLTAAVRRPGRRREHAPEPLVAR
ncbi:hypothetical protein ASC64_07710 [Nocardioides sp. Root122]|uniref:hypothetical protein n=1 Tax=Nocardioides TaxID=1839 RepID=UPI000702C4DD|nr:MULTISPECIES: hypothetical protein [Nocardioides]KQV69709.1 hypothetical protein ASC64_07710 [Nocardioides sp. Root122]MCK9824624.1 hypothetical protein [Nocardioides cavernae]